MLTKCRTPPPAYIRFPGGEWLRVLSIRPTGLGWDDVRTEDGNVHPLTSSTRYETRVAKGVDARRQRV